LVSHFAQKGYADLTFNISPFTIVTTHLHPSRRPIESLCRRRFAVYYSAPGPLRKKRLASCRDHLQLLVRLQESDPPKCFPAFEMGLTPTSLSSPRHPPQYYKDAHSCRKFPCLHLSALNASHLRRLFRQLKMGELSFHMVKRESSRASLTQPITDFSPQPYSQ
jgi:hypothetical protein